MFTELGVTSTICSKTPSYNSGTNVCVINVVICMLCNGIDRDICKSLKCGFFYYLLTIKIYAFCTIRVRDFTSYFKNVTLDFKISIFTMKFR